MIRPIFLGLFAVLCYSIAMNYEPQPTATVYSQADSVKLGNLIVRSLKETNPGASRQDINALFGREGVK